MQTITYEYDKASDSELGVTKITTIRERTVVPLAELKASLTNITAAIAAEPHELKKEKDQIEAKRARALASFQEKKAVAEALLDQAESFGISEPVSEIDPL